MNAYQRGNRDGLLSFAAFAKKQADILGVDAHKLSNEDFGRDHLMYRDARERAQRLLLRMVVWQEAAAEAERMAQALPEDLEKA